MLRVHVDCIARGRHVLINPHKMSAYAHELWGGCDYDTVRWPRPKAGCSFLPPTDSYRGPWQRLYPPARHGSSGPGGRSFLAAEPEKVCERRDSPVDELAKKMLGFPGVRGDCVVRRHHVDFMGPVGRPPLRAEVPVQTKCRDRAERSLTLDSLRFFRAGRWCPTRGPHSSLCLPTGWQAPPKGKIPTLLPAAADTLLASIDGKPNPPAYVERFAWACW